jgi:hypothetical protein
MKYRVPDIVLGALLTVAIFAMGMVFASSVFPPNAKPESATQEYSKQESSKSSTDEKIADYTWWLAVLTGGLVFVAVGQGVFIARSDKTARMTANAAIFSARAAVSMQLPIIVVKTAELVAASLDRVTRLAHHHIPPQSCALDTLKFRNVGLTPALVHEVGLGWRIAKVLPDIPSYPIKMPQTSDATIESQKTFTAVLPTHYILVSKDEQNLIKARLADLWVFGYLRYRDIVENEIRDARFCLRWAPNKDDATQQFAFISDRSAPAAYATTEVQGA